MKLIIAAALAMPAITQAEDPAPKKEKKAPDPNKRVCRQEASTGSRLSGSICHTRADWAAIDAHDNASAQEMVRNLPSSQR